MQEQRAPEQPRWYTRPREINVPYETIQKGPFPEEVAILIPLNGETKSAFVPAAAVDEKGKTIRGLAIGEIGDTVLVELPASSLGKTVLQISSSRIAELVVEH